MTKSMADVLREKRDAILAAAKATVDAALAEDRDLTDDEFASVTKANADAEAAETRAAELDKIAARSAAVAADPVVAAGQGGARVKSEPVTYTREGRNSYVRDLALSQFRGDRAATDRLARHAREVEVELRAGDTGDTAGGSFVPPLWVLSEYLDYRRAGRAAADLARKMPLPSGTDSINIPSITTGTLTAVQATENVAATTRDMVTSSTTAEITTIAGYYDSSLQLLEQSGIAWDNIVFGDLAKDYNRALGSLVLNGTGANNQFVGLTTAAATSVTVSTAAATALYAGIADAINRIQTTLYETPQVIVMHPRRWYWLASRYDSNGRPLVVPDAQAGQNLLATYGMQRTNGVVGTMIGLPVVVDPNVTTTSSTYFDEVYVWVPSEAILMEGSPRAEVFRDVLSASLGIRFRLYNYAAFSTRFSTATAKVTGAGLTGPTF